LGALVNTCKQCQIWQAGGCARCYAYWGGIFGWEISYLGISWLDTPIWDVLAPQGEQKQVLNHLTMCSRSPAFSIRQVVPVGIARVQFCCWAHWAQFSTIETMYIASYTIYMHNMIFLYIREGGNGWMQVDGFG